MHLHHGGKGETFGMLPGVPGIENILSLLLTLLNQGKISFKTIRRLLCENPAKYLIFPYKGFIKEGMDADSTVVDLKREGVIDPDNFKSKSRYTPFEGFQLGDANNDLGTWAEGYGRW